MTSAMVAFIDLQAAPTKIYFFLNMIPSRGKSIILGRLERYRIINMVTMSPVPNPGARTPYPQPYITKARSMHLLHSVDIPKPVRPIRIARSLWNQNERGHLSSSRQRFEYNKLLGYSFQKRNLSGGRDVSMFAKHQTQRVFSMFLIIWLRPMLSSQTKVLFGT